MAKIQGDTVAILAPGESLTQEIADSVKELPIIAVCDAYRLCAPWAIVSTDAAWWVNRPEALARDCQKFSIGLAQGVKQVTNVQGLISSGTSSGVLGCYVAYLAGAKRILMFGFDNRGTHFFGRHQAPLKNTTPARFEIFKLQFERLADFFKSKNVECLNCTPGSTITSFQQSSLAGLGL